MSAGVMVWRAQENVRERDGWWHGRNVLHHLIPKIAFDVEHAVPLRSKPSSQVLAVIAVSCHAPAGQIP